MRLKALIFLNLFLLSQANKNDWDTFAFVLPCSKSVWSQFDWEKLTTVALVNFVDRDLVSHAHSHHVKVVSLANINKTSLADRKARKAWVHEQVKFAAKNNLDGVNLDFEEDVVKGSPEAKGYTKLVSELSRAMHKRLPGSEVSVDVAWSPDCIDGRCYDYKAIADAADVLFVMSYDEQSQMGNSTTCTAKANSPVVKTFHGIKLYQQLGIPSDKLILGLPWYGYLYPCTAFDRNSHECQIKARPFRGSKCSDAAGTERPYGELARKSQSADMVEWDFNALAPYFSYRDGGAWYQVWYDNATSLSIKYNMARNMGLRGVGMWTANFLDYSNKTMIREMWGALP